MERNLLRTLVQLLDDEQNYADYKLVGLVAFKKGTPIGHLKIKENRIETENSVTININVQFFPIATSVEFSMQIVPNA